MAQDAIILFAHGSRDPLWREPVEAVARRIAAASPATPVACAYLEMTEPTLAVAAAAMVAAGARRVRIVPMFLGVGRHAREDLPQLVAALREAHPHAEFALKPAVGEDGRLVDLIAQIALEA